MTESKKRGGGARRAPQQRGNDSLRPSRISLLLNAAMAKAGISTYALSVQLDIDYRRLVNIVERRGTGSARLSLDELARIEEFIEEQLLLAFRRPLLGDLAAKGRVTFLLGAYARKEQRNDVSVWDLNAAMRLANELRQHGTVATEVETLVQPDAETEAGQVGERLREEWDRWLEGTTTSLVIVGSPRACSLSEGVLRRLFFERKAIPGTPGAEGMAEMPPTIQPPFHFIWPCGDQKGQSEGHAALELTSRFHLEPQAIGEPPDALGFKLADETMIECYRDHREKNPQPRVSLGVVAALRGSAGQLWVVLAGNTGPATDGIVTAFRECPELATVSVGPNPGDGFWAVVSVTVKEDPSVGRGENREITKVEVKRSPVHFPNALGHSSAAGTVLRKKRRGRPRQVPEGP